MAKITNKSHELCFIKLDQIIQHIFVAEFYAMSYEVCIKKQYYRRYQIIQKRYNQYQHNKKSRTGKYKIGEYKHLTTLEKVANIVT